MLGIFYLLLAGIIGYRIIKKGLPSLLKMSETRSLSGNPVKIKKWTVIIPSAFLIGTLVVTWFTYLATWLVNYIFPWVEKPLFYGNLITFLILIPYVLKICIEYHKNNIIKGIKRFDLSKIKSFLLTSRFERFFIISLLVIWTVLMFRSFYMVGKTLHVGVSVFSDFGNTLSIIRSFSWGSNFPTELPHFAGGIKGFNDIRYHFMFQFLAGNLEFLGLQIDFALNIPSILSIVSFLILLYIFGLLITGRKWISILTIVLYFFRSSFAFFTNIMDLKAKGLNSIQSLVLNIITDSTNIGRTEHEVWGFWTQKVFVNKRHFGFTLGIAIIVFLVIIPLYQKMISDLRKVRTHSDPQNQTMNNKVVVVKEERYGNVKDKTKQWLTSLRLWLKLFLFQKDCWVSHNIRETLWIGFILGLISFWNGATVISVLAVLFVLAILSKHRLTFGLMAILSIGLTYIQMLFFMKGSPANEIRMFIGFLASDKNFIGICQYYLELFGILPLLTIIAFLISPRGFRGLILAFLAPLVLATTFKFSIDIGANHVIIIFSIIFINIIISWLAYRIFKSINIWETISILILTCFYLAVSAYWIRFLPLLIATVVFFTGIFIISLFIKVIMKTNLNNIRIFSISVGVFLFLMLIATGVVDIFTLYNQDSGSIEYRMDDSEIMWIQHQTKPRDLFLIHPNYQHPVLLAGRKVFLGGLYFTWTSGYDNESRIKIVNQIYGAKNEGKLKKLVRNNKIRYIVIEGDNHTSTDYKLNEELIQKTYKRVYEDSQKQVAIYRTY